MENLLKYDDENMMTPAAQMKAVGKHLAEGHARMAQLRQSGEQGFFDLPYDLSGAKRIAVTARRIQQRFKTLLVIGIGGSDLGARMLYAAVGGSRMKLRFLTNPDPDAVGSLLDETDWKRTAVNVVSKSGTTLETSALFEVARTALIKAVGKTRHLEHVVATTEPSESSALFRLARQNGYDVLPHPTNVGGRFAALSNVGLFPAACSGADIRAVLKGARWLEDWRRHDKERSLPARFTTHHYLGYQAGRSIHVLMPYAEALFPFAMWYRQLWAESLGKRRGKNFVGPTPVAAYGPADQHSQIQLYNEGPDDKLITFIQPDRFKRAISVSGGMELGRIMRAELQGTARALARHGRPNGTLHVPSVSPGAVGALIMMYETATAYMGELLGINAFDQPGVEAGKAEARKILAGKR
jgi:glucose-6-phosphate isomerase